MSILQRIAQGLAGATLGGSVAAGCSAATLAIGARVFNTASYAGYAVGQAAAAGAVGSAVLVGGTGLLAGLALPPETWRMPDVELKFTGETLGGLLINGAVGSVVGAAILSAAGHQTMAVDSLFAASVCGGLLVSAGIVAVFLPMLLCTAVCAAALPDDDPQLVVP